MEYILSVTILTGIYVVLATSFNIVIGYGGLLSIAHPAFFGIGAYSSGLLALHLNLPVFLSILCGAAIAGIASLALSLASVRISGDYLLVASLGFMLAVIQLVNNVDFTNGAAGLTNIPPLLTGSQSAVIMMIWVWALAAGVVLLTRYLMNGPYGVAVRAMRDDEGALVGLGRNSTGMKTMLFALGSTIAGVVGALYAHYFQYVSAEQMGMRATILLLTMVVVGGLGTVWGPVLGAIAIQLIPQALSFTSIEPAISGALQGIIMTVIVIAVLFLRPSGLIVTKRRAPSRTHDLLPASRTEVGPGVEEVAQ